MPAIRSFYGFVDFLSFLRCWKLFDNSETFSRGLIKYQFFLECGLKNLVRLLSVFKDVSILLQTGTRPSLHMAYIAMNKLKRRLDGSDVDKNGETITIDDRHESK